MPIKTLLISLIFLTSGCVSMNAVKDLSEQGYTKMTTPEIQNKLMGEVTVYVVDRMHSPGSPVAHYYAEDGTMYSKYLNQTKGSWGSHGNWLVTENATLCHAWKKWGTHCYEVYTKQGAATTYVYEKMGFVNHIEVRVARGNPENF